MILIFVEQEAGNLRPASRDAVAFAMGIAQTGGHDVHAVTIGGASDVVAASMHGVATFHEISIDGAYAPAAWAQALADLCRGLVPAAVMAAGSPRGQEVMAYLGSKLGLPMVANILDVELDENSVVTREQWGGSVQEVVRVKASPLLATVAQTAKVREHDVDPADPVVERHSADPAPEDLRVRLARIEEGEGSGSSLSEAALVVSGGRGVGGPDRFGTLEVLCAKVGAAIGVSRAVTSAGWRPHAEQIGQTGVRIAPDLYIACGISGASQHMVGCLGAKRILAINTDPDAPIMSRADYAVVGDLHEVVPALVTELERRGV